jgi:hypothetical protein
MEVHYDEGHEDDEHALLDTSLSLSWWMDTRTKITLWHSLTFFLAYIVLGSFNGRGCLLQILARLIVWGGLMLWLLIQIKD